MGWLKDTWKKHPYAVGAVTAVGATVLTLGTGPVGVLVALAAAGAGGGVSKSIADEQERKDG
jgi:threonine dehydrogenase-like Zn-dependent dehydrogenase